MAKSRNNFRGGILITDFRRRKGGRMMIASFFSCEKPHFILGYHSMPNRAAIAAGTFMRSFLQLFYYWVV
jgi:hypothetical protein